MFFFKFYYSFTTHTLVCGKNSVTTNGLLSPGRYLVFQKEQKSPTMLIRSYGIVESDVEKCKNNL